MCDSYRTHDLKRGHSDDIMERGGSRAELLWFGDHSEKASSYKSYVDLLRAEALAVQEAHQVSSEDESEGEASASNILT